VTTAMHGGRGRTGRVVRPLVVPVAIAVVLTLAPTVPSAADDGVLGPRIEASGVTAAPDDDPGPFHGGPSDYFVASDGTEIALSVHLPHDYDPDETYPTIFEMAGYENASSSSDGRTMVGQARDALCAESPDEDWCDGFEPPLGNDTHRDTSAIRYRDEYVVVHANLPGSGCSSGEYSLYSHEHAGLGAEVIDDWIVDQPWSNGDVGLLGHSFSGATAVLIASHRPEHLRAMTVSGLVDDNYRGITFPGGVLNTLFPPLWYLGIRNAYQAGGGSAQGIARNLDDENGQRCLANTATHTLDLDNDPILNGVTAQGLDGDYWRRVSLITYIDRIDVPIHIAGTYQDEQTGARGTARLWENVRDGVPKRLLEGNGDHATIVDAEEFWADRKAWMDHWIRGVEPDPAWGWYEPGHLPDRTPDQARDAVGGGVEPASVRTLLEIHPGEDGELVSNGHIDGTSYPLEGTRWTDHYLCAGQQLTTGLAGCDEGSDTYVAGTRRQSWLYQAGDDAGPPLTSADGPDQIKLRGPVVEDGETWAISGPIVANLYLAAWANDIDLFVQVADENTETGELTFLQRGWLKASHREIDVELSDHSDVDPDRPGFLYRPHRPHVDPRDITPGEAIEYLVELWPVSHVFRPGHRPVVIVTAPPAIDSNYSFALQQTMPVTINELIYADPEHPSRITLPRIDLDRIQGLGDEGPGCSDYWRVRCTG
jgi:uncharacterized protein